jgi:HK97 family phage portal protein
VRWTFWRRAEPEQPANRTLSIADPTLAGYFTPGGLVDLAGVSVGETSAMGISALYRAVSLISGTLASLPLNTWTGPEGQRKKVPSVFDDPDGPDGQTPFEWKETAFIHQLLHGRCGALKVRNEAGGLVRLPLVHPLSFRVDQPTIDEQRDPARMPLGGVWFVVSLDNGEQVRLDANDFWYAPAASLGGQVGIGLLTYARQSLGTTIAGDRSAAKTFSNGALISGLATPADEYDITDDVPEIRRQLNNAVGGYENAGAIALVNRRLNFTPWTMTAQQAQFLESRQFQIEEISRWTGVPPHLLMQTDKQTSWGTGVDEQNRGLSRFVLGHWAQRFEQRGSRLLARPRWCEFDFAGLERPNFAVEIDLLIKQVQAGLLTVNEARAIRNLPPLPEPDPAPAPAPDEQDQEDGDAPAE